jgi:hypothetical protein
VGDRGEDGGGLPPARDQRADLPSLEGEVWRIGPAHAQRSPEDETRQLKKLLAESMLAVAALKDLLARS